MTQLDTRSQCLYINYSHLILLLILLAAFGLSNVVGVNVSEGNFSTSSVPDLEQVKKWMAAYGPVVYFHPDEEYLPSSVDWFFDNGALLYHQGNEANPVRIDSRGSNLPQGGTSDGAFWLDLPVDGKAKERVKKGDLGSAKGYVHVKPVLFDQTELAIWLFCPFNGPARAKVFFLDIGLGKIGSHVGDWEHITLRINNLDGKLQGMYLSEHSKGHWVIAQDLEYTNGNKPIVYASRHGHAMFAHGGLFLQGNKQLGLRNDMAKSNFVLDLGAKFEIISGVGIVEPPWLNYFRAWGPKFNYNLVDELKVVKKLLIFNKLKRKFEKFVNGLPPDILGQEGPTGPKGKSSWNGDEQQQPTRNGATTSKEEEQQP